MSFAATHPATYPQGPLPTLAHELSFLLGIQIDYFASIDLDGFQRMIDAVGGVTVNVEQPITDSFYHWLDGTPNGFYLQAGSQHFDGRTALAYVRSRYGIGENDYVRAGRQQQLLLALRARLTEPQMLGQLPRVLQVMSETVRTNFPADRLDEMFRLAEGLDGSEIERVVLQPPKFSFHPPTDTTGGSWQLRLKWDAVKRLSVRLFGADSAFWSGTAAPGSSPTP
jgi:LCP family protein required for cell wall assembly